MSIQFTSENQAHDKEVEDLKAKIERLKDENKWISVEDKPTPDYDGDYLATVIETEHCGATYFRVKVIQCLINLWILKDNQDLVLWRNLPKPTVTED